MRRIAIDVFLMVAIGTILGLVAPFGSAAMPGGVRLFFWVGFVLLGYAIFRPVSAVARWATEETGIPLWLAVILTTIVASLPLAALLAFALGLLRPGGNWFGSGFPALYGQVALVGTAIHLLMLALFARAAPDAALAQPAEPEPGAAGRDPDFLRRLPPTLGRDLLCLEMQDHYVRAQTRLGSTLLLMRLGDAIAELGPTGMQVHRSWWVAFAAMEGLDRAGRSAHLRIRGGGTVPVSRAHLPAVRRALASRRPGEFDTPLPPGKSAAGDAASGGQGITA
jgi:LytTr DNA-binding domain